jgi:hypothetical protein
LQKVQPPTLIFPSRLGHEKPGFTDIFCTLSEKYRRIKVG